MIWTGALQKTGTLSRLEQHGRDVRAVTVYTHTFVLGGEDGMADDRENPFFTASGTTPQEAEARAREVYLKAVGCSHRMKRKGPMLMECTACGVQQRTALAASASSALAEKPKGKPSKSKSRAKSAGWLSWLRTA